MQQNYQQKLEKPFQFRLKSRKPAAQLGISAVLSTLHCEISVTRKLLHYTLNFMGKSDPISTGTSEPANLIYPTNIFFYKFFNTPPGLVHL